MNRGTKVRPHAVPALDQIADLLDGRPAQVKELVGQVHALLDEPTVPLFRVRQLMVEHIRRVPAYERGTLTAASIATALENDLGGPSGVLAANALKTRPLQARRVLEAAQKGIKARRGHISPALADVAEYVVAHGARLARLLPVRGPEWLANFIAADKTWTAPIKPNGPSRATSIRDSSPTAARFVFLYGRWDDD